MPEEKGTVIIGLHDRSMQELTQIILSSRGYFSVSAFDYETMKDEISRNPDAVGYLMDINLGNPKTVDIAPFRNIYDLVKDRVESGDAILIGVSGYNPIFEVASRAGISSRFLKHKHEYRIDEFIREIDDISKRLKGL